MDDIDGLLILLFFDVEDRTGGPYRASNPRSEV